MQSSYKDGQVTCLFSNFEGNLLSIEDKEAMIRSGENYGNILSEEDRPEDEYLNIFDNLNKKLSTKLSVPIMQLVEHFHTTHPVGRPIVLLSIARAGTPIGVVISSILKSRFNREVHHYSISVIHGYGIDKFAMDYVLKNHSNEDVIFLDGWVSQGRITKTIESTASNWSVNPQLYCVSDPSGIQNAVATREDILLPSAILNATVSGLLSRSVYNSEGFDTVEYYSQYKDIDRTHHFIDQLVSCCNEIDNIPQRDIIDCSSQRLKALKQINNFCNQYGVIEKDIKVGIGEVSRSLLRRIPTLVVVDHSAKEEVEHMIYLSKKRNIELVFKNLNGPFRAFSILN